MCIQRRKLEEVGGACWKVFGQLQSTVGPFLLSTSFSLTYRIKRLSVLPCYYVVKPENNVVN